MSFFKNKENVLILCIAALVLFLSWGRNLWPRQEAVSLQAVASTEAETAEPLDLFVHLTGRVRRPGVVQVQAGDRLLDAVEAAGGLYPDADTTRINLSQKLRDEDKIHIPAQGETSAPGQAETGSDPQVDLNHATQAELETLPGIGPALAQRIIEYRESSPFTSPDEIRNVRGIGDKLFEGMKEMITVRE